MDKDTSIRLAIETLDCVVEGAENMEVCIMHSNGKIENVDDEKLTQIAKEIKAEKEAAEAAKKNKKKD